MPKNSPLEILSATSRLNGLSPDAASSLNALSFKLASDHRLDRLEDEASESNPETLNLLFEKADKSPFLD